MDQPVARRILTGAPISMEPRQSVELARRVRGAGVRGRRAKHVSRMCVMEVGTAF
jgi:hypothetical protein